MSSPIKVNPKNKEDNDVDMDSVSSDVSNDDDNNLPNGVGANRSGQTNAAAAAAATGATATAAIGAVPTTTTGITLQEAGSTKKATLLPLDWTKQACDEVSTIPISYPGDVTDIGPEETEIVVVGTAGQKITNIGPDFSSSVGVNRHMKTLIFRSHLITKLEGMEQFTELDLLELYDNQVQSLEGVHSGPDGAPGQSLRVLDMSFNSVRDMQPVEFCPNLQELYLAQNKLKSMAGLKGFTKLRKLDLGANRIRVMDADELSGLINLEELWLGKNKIEIIQGLQSLTKLRRLDVQSNRLTTIENISHPEILEELYLAHNAITSDGAAIVTGLSQQFPNLSVLDLSRNQLTSTSPFQHLTALEELWISGNQITTFLEVEPIRSLGTTLQTIYLEYNPVQQEPLYRKVVAEMLPSLTQIDAYLVGDTKSHGMSTTNPATSSTAAATTSIVKPKDPVKEIMTALESDEEKARKLQELIVQRAKEETEKQGKK